MIGADALDRDQKGNIFRELFISCMDWNSFVIRRLPHADADRFHGERIGENQTGNFDP